MENQNQNEVTDSSRLNKDSQTTDIIDVGIGEQLRNHDPTVGINLSHENQDTSEQMVKNDGSPVTNNKDISDSNSSKKNIQIIEHITINNTSKVKDSSEISNIDVSEPHSTNNNVDISELTTECNKTQVTDASNDVEIIEETPVLICIDSDENESVENQKSHSVASNTSCESSAVVVKVEKNVGSINSTTQILEDETIAERKRQNVPGGPPRRPRGRRYRKGKIVGFKTGTPESPESVRAEDAQSLVDRRIAELKDSKEPVIFDPNMLYLGKHIGKRKGQRIKKMQTHLEAILETGLVFPEDIKQTLIKESNEVKVSHPYTLMHKLAICRCYAEYLKDDSFEYEGTYHSTKSTDTFKNVGTDHSTKSTDQCGVSSSSEEVIFVSDSKQGNGDHKALTSSRNIPPKRVVNSSSTDYSKTHREASSSMPKNGNINPIQEKNHFSQQKTANFGSAMKTPNKKARIEPSSNQHRYQTRSSTNPPQTPLLTKPPVSSGNLRVGTGRFQYFPNKIFIPAARQQDPNSSSPKPSEINALTSRTVPSPSIETPASTSRQICGINFAESQTLSSVLPQNHIDMTTPRPRRPYFSPVDKSKSDSSVVVPQTVISILSPSSAQSDGIVSQNAKVESEERIRRKFQVLVMSNRDKGKVYLAEKEAVRSHLVAEMLKSMVAAGPSGPELHFKQPALVEPGWYSVFAEDDVSFDWLLNGCPPLIINQTTFRQFKASDLSKISLTLTASTVDINVLFSILFVQNRSLKVDTWMQLETSGKARSWNVIFLISSEVADKLKSQEWTVYYEIDKLPVRLLPLCD